MVMISESEEEAKRERVPITRDGNSKLARSARVSIEKACREDAQTAMAGALEVKILDAGGSTLTALGGPGVDGDSPFAHAPREMA